MKLSPPHRPAACSVSHDSPAAPAALAPRDPAASHLPAQSQAAASAPTAAGSRPSNASVAARDPALGFLPAPIRGIVAATLLGLNTVFWCTALFACAVVKLVLPVRAVRERIDPVLNGIATRWIACNSAWMRLTQPTQWDVAGVEGLTYRGWYLVNANHQSWADILALQHVLNRRIPMLKFFLKHQLVYVPVIGLAWWALDFPFMRRHSPEYLRKHPGKRLDDLETSRRACEKFALVPTSVMNFAEGTRFTRAKWRSQDSPYRHLLKPKAGALALALDVLGDRFESLLDVTIVYPDGAPTFWAFLCGRVQRVIVRVQTLPIPAALRHGDYAQDDDYRQAFQEWLAAMWRDKDAHIAALLAAARPRSERLP